MSVAPSLNYTLGKKYKFLLAGSCSLFTYLFLLFFQPFGINNYRPDEKITLLLAMVLLVFGLIVFVSFLICEFVIRPGRFTTLRISNFYLWLVLEIILVGSVSFFFYNLIGGFHDFHVQSYLKHLLEMGSILFFPIAGTLFYFRYTTVVSEYEAIISVSEESPDMDHVVLFSGDYKKDKIALNLQNVLYIQSEDNYASLNYLEDNEVKKYLIRSTLSSLEHKITVPTLVRCNRSTLVNLIHLESSRTVDGKLYLKLTGVHPIFEVPRSRRDDMIRRIEQLCALNGNRDD